MAPAPVYREPKGEFPPGVYRMSWNSEEAAVELKDGGAYSWKTWSGRYRYDPKKRTFDFEDLPEHLGRRRLWSSAVDADGRGTASGFYGRAEFRIWKGSP